mmetsp:Transcript_16543/g.28124  ORF Transcript_16543/g.28124 Transcript_16543/m.28124 type:complete len:100 (+) Transcript_16543:291-590(+)
MASNANNTKKVILFSFVAFFLMYNRLGFINRLLFCTIASQGLIFFTKCNYYKKCIDELNYEMTLAGQESRILTMYYFSDHPELNSFKILCEKYKEHSLN